MASNRKPSPLLPLDPPVELRITHQVMKRYTALTGKAMGEMVEDVDHYDRMVQLVGICLAVAAEARGQVPPTSQEVDRMLETIPVKATVRAVAAALVEALGTDGDEEDREPGEAQPAAGTGG